MDLILYLLAVEGFLVDRLSSLFRAFSPSSTCKPQTYLYLFIECATIVGVGLLITCGTAHVLYGRP